MNELSTSAGTGSIVPTPGMAPDTVGGGSMRVTVGAEAAPGDGALEFRGPLGFGSDVIPGQPAGAPGPVVETPGSIADSDTADPSALQPGQPQQGVPAPAGTNPGNPVTAPTNPAVPATPVPPPAPAAAPPQPQAPAAPTAPQPPAAPAASAALPPHLASAVANLSGGGARPQAPPAHRPAAAPASANARGGAPHGGSPERRAASGASHGAAQQAEKRGLLGLVRAFNRGFIGDKAGSLLHLFRGENKAGGNRWKIAKSLALTVLSSIAIKTFANWATGGMEAVGGAAAALASQKISGNIVRREHETRPQHVARILGEMAFGALLTHVMVVGPTEFGHEVADGMRSAGDAAQSAGEHINHFLHGTADHIDSSLGPETPTPEVPLPEVPIPTVTEAIGPFDGSYDPTTHFYNGTGYNAVANQLMSNYLANTGQVLDWHVLHAHAFHTDMMQPTLEQNGIGDGYSSVWEGAKHMSDSATLTVDPDTIESFVKELNETTGQHFNAKDFMHFGPAEGAPIGAEGISVDGLSPEMIQETNVELGNYLDGPGHGFAEAIANGTLASDPAAYEAFKHGFMDYLRNSHSDLAMDIGSQAVFDRAPVEELFQGILAQHAVAPAFDAYMSVNAIDPGVSIYDYVRIFEGGSAAYQGVPDAVRAVIHQHLMEQAARHFDLVGASA